MRYQAKSRTAPSSDAGVRALQGQENRSHSFTQALSKSSDQREPKLGAAGRARHPYGPRAGSAGGLGSARGRLRFPLPARQDRSRDRATGNAAVRSSRPAGAVPGSCGSSRAQPLARVPVPVPALPPPSAVTILCAAAGIRGMGLFLTAPRCAPRAAAGLNPATLPPIGSTSTSPPDAQGSFSCEIKAFIG